MFELEQGCADERVSFSELRCLIYQMPREKRLWPLGSLVNGYDLG